MLRGPMFLSLLLLVCVPASASLGRTPEEAEETALDLVQGTAAYSVAHPDAPGAFNPWVGGVEVVECRHLHSPETRELLYYRVVLQGSERSWVVRGYDDATDVFIVHDPWYAEPFSGPNVHFNQEYLVDTLSNHSDLMGDSWSCRGKSTSGVRVWSSADGHTLCHLWERVGRQPLRRLQRQPVH